jgi:site-specific recombinase XerD
MINQFLRYKARQDRADRYLRAMRVSPASFAKGHRNLSAESVTIQDAEAWLDGQDWAPRTKLGYLRDVRTLYNWARKRNLVSHNPANAVEAPRLID